MPDSKHTLEIVSTLNDQASGKLKKLGVEGEKAGKKTEKSLKRVEVQAKKTGRSMFDAGQAGSKGAGIAGAGFSSLAAGMTAANATAENMEASMVSVGAAVAASFAAGGPVGAGLALAATGLGLLIGKSKAAGRAAEEAAKKFEEGFKRSAEATKKATDALSGLNVEVLALKKYLAGDQLDVGRLAKAIAIKEQTERVDRLARAWREAASGAEDAAAARARALGKVKAAGPLGNEFADEVSAAERRFGQAQATAGVKRDELAAQQKLLATMREEFNLSAEATQLMEEKAAAVEKVKQSAVETKEAVKEEKEWHVDTAKVLSDKAALVDKLRTSEAAASARRARELEQERNLNRSIDDRLELLRASNDFERDKIRLLQEKQDLIEKGADAAKAEALYNEQLAGLYERQLDSKKEAAGVEVAKADAAERTAKPQQDDLDITKRFESVAGTGGLFGFGKGRAGFGGFSGGQVRRRRTRVQAPGGAGANAGAGGGAGQALPDPSPHIAEAAGALAEIRPLFDKFTETGKLLAKEARLSMDHGWDKVSDFAVVVGSEMRSMRAKIRSLEQGLARSGDLAVAGGA